MVFMCPPDIRGVSDELWHKACGKDRRLGDLETIEEKINSISNASMWKYRCAGRKDFINYFQERTYQQKMALNFT